MSSRPDKDRKLAARKAQLDATDPKGWRQYTKWHWGRELRDGSYIQYWPSSGVFRWQNRVMSGDVWAFIRDHS